MGSSFKAVIVGGSVAGLVLAHCFDSAGIDYVVLEARKDIAPALGATIIMMPNGTRILDQLGLYEDMKSVMEEIDNTKMWKSDGKLMCQLEWAKVLKER